jgi:thiamine-phosphate pyrophosphorylase
MKRDGAHSNLECGTVHDQVEAAKTCLQEASPREADDVRPIRASALTALPYTSLMPMLPAVSRLPGRGLYAITDGPRPDLLAAVDAVLRGGAALVQYRDKTGDASRRLDEATALAALCRRHSVPLLINDDVDLARTSGAAGVHLGADDETIDVARAVLGPSAIIGLSCYDSLQRARDAATAGADYLAFGAFFASPTKPHARTAGVELLRAARRFGLPLVAIGGITPDNAPPLIAAGADFVAAISGVFRATDPGEIARQYANCFRTRINADDRG